MRKVREYNVNFNGREYLFHPAGSGNPTEDRIAELICENLPTNGTVLFVECGEGIISAQSELDSVSFHTNFIDYEYGKINSPKSRHYFEDITVSNYNECFTTIIFRITKASAYNLKVISTLLKLLDKDGFLSIAGGNKEGIKGIFSKLKKSGIVADIVANGGGGRILSLPYGSEFDYKEELIPTTYNVHDQEIEVSTIEGLFAYGKVDKGSSLLLSYIPTLKNKRVLDLGCGSGILSKYALMRGAKEVVASDISSIALYITEKNLEEHTDKVETIPSYMGDIIDDKFDIILTNPPFHEGTGTTSTIGEEWMKACNRLIDGRGTLFMVANQFLPYHRWGRLYFDTVIEHVRANGFVVYEMKGPKR